MGPIPPSRPAFCGAENTKLNDRWFNPFQSKSPIKQKKGTATRMAAIHMIAVVADSWTYLLCRDIDIPMSQAFCQADNQDDESHEEETTDE